jgi:signal transduction histidine kinase
VTERTIIACPVSAGFHRLALVRLGAITLLLILCLAHAAHDLPVPLALPFAICFVWAAFAAGYWALQQAARQQGARRRPAETEPRRRYRDDPGALSVRAAHDLSTPVSTMLLVVGELRRSSGTPPPDWTESVDTLWVQLQLCRRALHAATRPGEAPQGYIDPDLAATFGNGEHG